MSMQQSQIEKAVLDTPVEGMNLNIGTLRDQIEHRPALLVFLRHFGCVFCRETVADLQHIAKQDPHYPKVVFFFQGTRQAGEDFFGDRWNEGCFVADDTLFFYRAFGLDKGGVREMFSAEVWACTARAMVKGNLPGKRVGDGWMMPGVFLVKGNQILWQHEFEHIGDAPKWREIVQHIPEYKGTMGIDTAKPSEATG